MKPTYEELLKERDELAAHVERVNIHGRQCADELARMIDRHKTQDPDDGSYDYDHQTPCDLMRVIGASPAASLAAHDAALLRRMAAELMNMEAGISPGFIARIYGRAGAIERGE